MRHFSNLIINLHIIKKVTQVKVKKAHQKYFIFKKIDQKRFLYRRKSCIVFLFLNKLLIFLIEFIKNKKFF
jgi:hypothetical protein